MPTSSSTAKKTPTAGAASAHRWAPLLVALGSSLWGTDTVFRRPLTAVLPSTSIVFYEHLLLGAALLPLIWLGREQWRRLTGREWVALVAIAWGGSAIATILFTQAIKLGNPTAAVLLQKSQPLFAVLFAATFLGERLRSRHWLYLALAMAGAYLVSFGETASGLFAPFSGVAVAVPALLALAAAGLWASCTVLGRYVAPRLNFGTMTALRILLALPLLLVLVVARGYPVAVSLAGRQWVSLVAMAAIPGGAALMLYYRGLRHTPASLAAIAELAFPATAAVLNWAFLDAHFSLLQLAGFALLWSVIIRLKDG